MLDSLRLVALSTDFELETAELKVTVLLEIPELEDKFLVRLRFVAKVVLKFVNAALLLVLAFSQVVNFALVQISQVLLHVSELLCLTVFQILNFFRVLEVEFRLDIVIC